MKRAANVQELLEMDYMRRFAGVHKRKITKIIVMGDSLSERGTLEDEKLLGVIPFACLSGLEGKSPQGRFTNGYSWSDFFIAALANSFEIDKMKSRLGRKFVGNDDLADAFISGDAHISNHVMSVEEPVSQASSSSGPSAAAPVKRARCEDDIINHKLVSWSDEPAKDSETDYNLDNSKAANFKNKEWIRTYCVGGMTAYDWGLTASIPRYFTRKILTKLADQRKLLLEYDRLHGVTPTDKEETLIIEWSGANDLITVNASPTEFAANKVIEARIHNARRLFQAGYKQIVLFNQPDIACTPRYHNSRSPAEQAQASHVSSYLNAGLEVAAKALEREFPDCRVDVFDISSAFQEVYTHPEKYGFDPQKLHSPYTLSPDFDDPRDGISAANGYFSYDDVHPTADAHARFAVIFYAFIREYYEFFEPCSKKQELMALREDEILTLFRASYQQLHDKKLFSFFGDFFGPHWDYRHASLREVIQRALRGNTMVRTVLVDIGLFDEQGQPVRKIPAVAAALQASQLSNMPVCSSSTFTPE